MNTEHFVFGTSNVNLKFSSSQSREEWKQHLADDLNVLVVDMWSTTVRSLARHTISREIQFKCNYNMLHMLFY